MNILIIKHPNVALKMFQVKDEYLDNIAQVGGEIEVNLAGVSDLNFKELLNQAEIIVAQNLDGLNAEDAKNLKWMHFTSAGINRMPEWILNSDILVTNSSGVHPVPIAEQILGYMLMFARDLHKFIKAQVTTKEWMKEKSGNVFELEGKTVSIIGMGRIGEKLAEYSKALGMKTIGVVRDVSKHQGSQVDKLVSNEDLEKVLVESDFVVNCLPLTTETKQLFNKKMFEQFKKGSYFINIGRGQTVNEQDLVEVLREGLLAGAALDVFEVEPLPENSPLWEMENVIISPHMAGHTPFYMERVIEIFRENLKAYKSGEKMANLVNKHLGY